MSESVFLVVIIAAVVTWASGVHVTVSPLPGKAESISRRDVALIVIPESGVSHTEYTVLGRVIQQIYPLRMWVSLLDIAKEETLTLDNLPLLLGESMKELSNAGIHSDPDIFLAVHGLRGHVTADYAQAVPLSLRGLILLGTFLPKRFHYDSFPLPVLTIVGEIDGVVRITRLAQIVQSMILADQQQPGLVIQRPIVLLEGANHDTFVQGDLPAWLHVLDIQAEGDKTVATTKASNLTAIFIASILQEPEGSVETAQLVFQATFEHAKNLIQPIISLIEMTQDNLKSYWVKSAQKWLSGLEGKQSTQLEVDSYVVADRTLPPTLVKEHGINYVITFSDVIQRSENDDKDQGLNPQAPEEIAARMLGPERIREYLKNSTIAHNYTCQDLNYASFMTAYHSASERARNRYNNYHRGVIFEPDIVTDSEALWESTRLKLDTVDHVLHVTSISYQTANDQALSPYDGLFFCKLLAPDRALEWIYVDSLRRSMSNIQNN
uniref:Uncharacterized protein n=1 Tax=Arion vulgaris TaxID=1028688 RepID=A0A0B6Z683_9EUPU